MSLNYRKDFRSEEQFKEDIQRRTQKERVLLKLYIKYLKGKGFDVSYQDNGIDNTGKLITKRTDCRPDYKVTSNGQSILLEIKSSPVDYKWTFKTYHLGEYTKYGAAILVYWGTGFRMEKLKDAYWGIIPPHNIKPMLDKYDEYTEPKFGFKPCIQIPSDDFHLWVPSIHEVEL